MQTCALVVLACFLAVLPVVAATDAEMAGKQGVVAPETWIFLPQHPPRVLLVRGLWHEYYGIERALARIGGALVQDCWTHPKGVRFYPDSYEELMTYHLIVIDNISGAALGPVRRKMLADYVQHGGTVLMLGGFYAYDASYHNSALEELAPVIFPEKETPRQALEGLLLAAGPDVVGNSVVGLSWNLGPRVFWYHALTPKPGAKVLVTADGKPLLIAGAYGKGRVAVFAGSVMGDPHPGQLPFWNWDGWPALTASTIAWLLDATKVPDAGTPAAYRALLTTQLARTRGKRDQEQAVLTKYARLCGDRESAKTLLDIVVKGDDDIDLDTVASIDAAVAPYLDATLAPLATQLIKTGQTHKASLGLRLLGGTRVTSDAKVLEDALENGDAGEGENTGGLDDAGGGVPQDPAYRTYVLRLGALEGLGRRGDPAALPLVNKYRAEFAKTRCKLADHPSAVTQDEELYQEAVLAALRCGDADAAAPALDALWLNRYIFVQMSGILDQQLQEPDPHMLLVKKRVAQEIPRQQQRIAQQQLKMSKLPDNVLTALAARISADRDPKIAALAQLVFGSNANPDRKWLAGIGEILKKSAVSAVAELGTGM